MFTIDSKSSVKQVLCSSDHSTDHRQSSATVLVLLIGFAQQLRLEIPVILTPSDTRKTHVRKRNTSEIRYYKMLALCLPVVENLWNLSSCLVGPIATQAARAEGEGHTIRALHCGHTSIPIDCPAAIVSQSNSILYPLL